MTWQRPTCANDLALSRRSGVIQQDPKETMHEAATLPRNRHSQDGLGVGSTVYCKRPSLNTRCGQTTCFWKMWMMVLKLLLLLFLSVGDVKDECAGGCEGWMKRYFSYRGIWRMFQVSGRRSHRRVAMKYVRDDSKVTLQPVWTGILVSLK